ncbi:MAG: hypothetical protein U0997_06580 [Sulfurimicrobium sp.]|nr:hypothetical protein [Sulfurimicrobium sp.]
MNRRNWKKVNPRSLREAMELCKDHAQAVHHRSVERIAELAGEESQWTVYGWLRDGSIPGKKIMAFQHACGCDFITRWLSHSAGKLLIDMPHGRQIDAEDVHQLQGVLNAAVGALLGFASGGLDADQVGSELNAAMEALAWHRENVSKTRQPEFEFGGDQQ